MSTNLGAGGVVQDALVADADAAAGRRLSVEPCTVPDMGASANLKDIFCCSPIDFIDVGGACQLPVNTPVAQQGSKRTSLASGDLVADSSQTQEAPVNNPNLLADLYIAGPMTGLPEFNFPAFFEAEARLRANGYEIRNPARHGAGHPDASWSDYMRRDIPDLLACRAVALLPGWQKSRGATLEVHIAESLDMEIKAVDEWMSICAKV